MPTTPEQLASLYQANLAQGLRVAAVAYEAGQQLLRLNLETGASLMAEGLRPSHAAPGEALTAWSRAAIDIAQNAQARCREIFEEGDAGALQGVFVGLFDDAMRTWSNAPERA